MEVNTTMESECCTGVLAHDWILFISIILTWLLVSMGIIVHALPPSCSFLYSLGMTNDWSFKIVVFPQLSAFSCGFSLCCCNSAHNALSWSKLIVSGYLLHSAARYHLNCTYILCNIHITYWLNQSSQLFFSPWLPPRKGMCLWSRLDW